jgi:hypothetical protein
MMKQRQREPVAVLFLHSAFILHHSFWIIRRARQRRRGNAEGRRMNDELTPTRAGCRLVSSFFIHTSSFAFPWPPSRPVSPCDWRQ